MSSSLETRFLFRPLVDTDFEAIAELTNHYDPGSTNGEIMRARLKRWQAGDPRLDLVVEDGGSVIAYASCLRRASDPEGKFSAGVVVSPDAIGQGIALQLHTAIIGYALQNGASYLLAYLKENGSRGIRFAESNGYRRVQHLFDSELALESFDPAPTERAIAKLETRGYTFVTLSGIGNTEENRRRIYELDVTSDVDTPGFENWGRRSFEQYCRDEFDSFGFSPEFVFIAEFAGEWVAMHSCRHSPLEGVMKIDYTGVLREHRGNGLAQALKLLALGKAKTSGATAMRTSNDERNAVMLAINEKMGFKPEPGFYFYRKDIRAEASQAAARTASPDPDL